MEEFRSEPDRVMLVQDPLSFLNNCRIPARGECIHLCMYVCMYALVNVLVNVCVCIFGNSCEIDLFDGVGLS